MSDHGGIAYKLDDPNAPPSSSDGPTRRTPYFSTADYLIAVAIILTPFIVAFWLGVILGLAVLGFRLVT